MIDEDINTLPDYNSYEPDEYEDLSESVAGNVLAKTGTMWGMLAGFLILAIIAIIIYYFILSVKQK